MLTTSCGGTPVTPEQRRLAERAYLSPFLQNTRVVCEQLEVEITPNFHLHVSNPGVDKRHQRFDREQKPALVEKTWRNLTGDRRAWFSVTISEPSDPETPRIGKSPGTTYTVMNQFTLRIRERGEMTLSARAYGGIATAATARVHDRKRCCEALMGKTRWVLWLLLPLQASCFLFGGGGGSGAAYTECSNAEGRSAWTEAKMALASGDKQAALPHLVVATNKCPDLVRAHIEYQNLAKSLGGESEQAMVDFYMKMPERAPDDASPVPAYMRARLADTAYAQSNALDQILRPRQPRPGPPVRGAAKPGSGDLGGRWLDRGATRTGAGVDRTRPR